MHGHWQYFSAHTHELKVKPSSCIFTSCQGNRTGLPYLHVFASFCAPGDDDGNRSLPRLAIFLHQRPLQETCLACTSDQT